jgi:hypothetical protein
MDSYWIYHGYSDEKRVDVGKWMLFWPQTLLAQKWLAICKAWDEGQLLGVIGCSTEKPNPRSSNPAEGVIILYCNNSEDEEFISAMALINTILLSQNGTHYGDWKLDKPTFV